MKTSKFIRFLSILNKKEVRRFDKFLQSDYHDTEPKTHELWTYILREYPHTGEREWTKTDASKAVYGDDQHSTHITNRLAELSRVMQDFLILEHLNSDDVGRAMLILEVLKSRDMSHLSLLQIGKAERLLEKQAQRNMTHYYHKFRLAYERYFHPEISKIKANAKELLEAVTEHLEEFYVLARLRHICEMRIRKQVYGEEYGMASSGLDDLLQRTAKMNSPLPDIYSAEVYLTGTTDDKAYRILKDKILTYIELADLQERYRLLTFLINYQSGQLRKGAEDAVQEVFELYRFGLENDIFVQGQYWSVTHFINAITIACELGHTNWATTFIHQNGKKLPSKISTGIPIRKKVLYLCEGYVNFATGDYSTAIRRAYLARPADFTINLRSWTLEIQARYELRHETEGIHEELNKFNNFLQHNKKKLAIETVEGNQRFIQFIKKLLRAEYSTIYTKDYFIEQLDWQTQYIVCKPWLKRKIHELKI